MNRKSLNVKEHRKLDTASIAQVSVTAIYAGNYDLSVINCWKVAYEIYGEAEKAIAAR